MTHSLRRMVGVIACAATWFVTVSSQQPAIPSARRVADEVIVQYKSQSPRSRRDAVVARRGARVLRRLENIDRVRLATGAAVDAEIAALENDPDVEAVQPNFIREVTLVPNDPCLGQQQSLGPAENSGAFRVDDFDGLGAGRRRRHRHRRQLHPSRSRAKHVAEPRRNRRQRHRR